MKLLKTVALGLCLTLMGCAPHLVDFKTSRIQGFKDWRICSYEAEQAVPTKYRYSKDFDPVVTLTKFTEFRTKCLKQRGYHY
ncbi:MAG: hypothetical protein IMZ61_11140 [Planctomycetes bacterium]|nr:hypothetical protein [Planctomycetota bacterium]